MPLRDGEGAEPYLENEVPTKLPKDNSVEHHQDRKPIGPIQPIGVIEDRITGILVEEIRIQCVRQHCFGV